MGKAGRPRLPPATAAVDADRAVARARSRAWHDRHRAAGLCPRCRQPATVLNPRTGSPYWHCFDCRLKLAAWVRRRYAARSADA